MVGGHRKTAAGLIALLLLLPVGGSPSTAGPLDRRVVAAADTFVPAEITISKGERLEFTNLEPRPHNLIAIRLGPDGRPAFRTETIGAATTVVVKGLEKLAPGVYDYTCTLHPAMLGTIFLKGAYG